MISRTRMRERVQQSCESYPSRWNGAKEMRALVLTVSLKSGMEASSQDFGKALLNTLAKSDVRMGLHDHIRDLGFDAYTGRRPRKTCSQCTGFSGLGSLRRRCEHFEDKQRGLLHAGPQMSQVAACSGDGGA